MLKFRCRIVNTITKWVTKKLGFYGSPEDIQNSSYSERMRYLYKERSFSFLWETGKQSASLHSREINRRKIEENRRDSNCTLSDNTSSVFKSCGLVSLHDIVLKEWSVTILNISAFAVYFHSWISHVIFVAVFHCIAAPKSEEVKKNLNLLATFKWHKLSLFIN